MIKHGVNIRDLLYLEVGLMENGLKQKLDQIPVENNLMEKSLNRKWSNWKLF